MRVQSMSAGADGAYGAFRKVVVGVLTMAFAASMLWAIFIHLSYDHKMPQAPQPDTGRVYRMTVNHGDVVYVTKGELDRAQFVLNKVFWVGMACFGVLIILKVRWKV